MGSGRTRKRGVRFEGRGGEHSMRGGAGEGFVFVGVTEAVSGDDAPARRSWWKSGVGKTTSGD